MQQARFSIGIDLGGTSTRVGLFDRTMKLRATRTMVTRVAAGPSSAVAEMAAAIAAVTAELQLEHTPGVGIGSPGPIDLQKGMLGLLPNLPGWENFPLRSALREAARTTVVLESDANAAALGEWKLGAGRASRADDMAMLTLGTGVGGGLILNGRIWHGMAGMAGEVGHATVAPEGEPCGCGSRGCLERYASAGAVVRFYLGNAPPSGLNQPATLHTAHSVAELAEQGDPAALGSYQQLGHFLGIGIANLLNTLDLPLVVVGGGVVEAWDLFSPSMFKAVSAYSVLYRLSHPPQGSEQKAESIAIVRATLGSAAGLIGAALLVAEAHPSADPTAK